MGELPLLFFLGAARLDPEEKEPEKTRDAIVDYVKFWAGR